MANWYTADLHFNHGNIISHCGRPFASVEEMDNHILQRLQCVNKEDDLWVLGDFAFARNAASRRYVAEIFEAIPGRKHLIRGNHDHKSTVKLPWASVQDLIEIKDQEQNLVLCHYPLVSWNRERYGALHLFGHVHDEFKGYRGALNVGVDCCNFRPIKLREVQFRTALIEDGVVQRN
ncbi:metallophosphoesterase [Sulfitobacter sp.]|jgi:calcineurin-like phosphoesterase family protein|uniref:metallophosphoesterase n=1 Tax=Sulfitobacter sp. TaxID=1903071 RepID=UPI0039E72457